MTQDQIQHIVRNSSFPDTARDVRLFKTHISWVVVSDNFAFKIKRPASFNFLDFSTLEKRKYFCEEELRLNRRLAPKVYLEVLPVVAYEGGIRIGGSGGTIIDYAVKMQRLNNHYRMDAMLENATVTKAHLQSLAVQLAQFHQSCPPVKLDKSPEKFIADFEDIRSVFQEVNQFSERGKTGQLEEMITFSKSFIHKNYPRLMARSQCGFYIEGHGDLHSGNIILTENPIIFDCIEFSRKLRQLDVLDEIAFLCMDLEAHGEDALSQAFIDFYKKEYPVFEKPADTQLFIWFKMYRANIRLKVTALGRDIVRKQKVQTYLNLMEVYYSILRRIQ